MEKRKLGKADELAVDEETRRRIAKHLRKLQDECTSYLKAASINREALRSQISWIRETIDRVLN